MREDTRMKTFTSASAGKYIRQLEDDKAALLDHEHMTCTYVLAKDEEGEAPTYSYAETRAKIDEIDAKVLRLRHALHRFNMETKLPDCDMTIDEALILMAQLSNKKNRLNTLRSTLPVERVSGRFVGNLIEYRYANYDVAAAQADFDTVTEQIFALQLKIDLCNQTMTFDVEV